MSKHLKNLKKSGQNKSLKIAIALFYWILMIVAGRGMRYLSVCFGIDPQGPLFMFLTFSVCGIIFVRFVFSLKELLGDKMAFFHLVYKISIYAYVVGLIFSAINLITNGAIF